jgi:hypothetical protein
MQQTAVDMLEKKLFLEVGIPKRKGSLLAALYIESKVRPARVERATFCFIVKRAASKVSTI